jgi:hypothetical protein
VSATSASNPATSSLPAPTNRHFLLMVKKNNQGREQDGRRHDAKKFNFSDFSQRIKWGARDGLDNYDLNA